MSFDLCKKLLDAQSEAEVERIIAADPVLSNDNNWKPIGGFRGNFSQIHNQQGKSIPSLVEKPINSIDAILIKECKLKGIDPTSPSAPLTIHDAIEKFMGIKNANFADISEARCREIAKSIQILAIGSREAPTLCVYDDGEGQHPLDFENTFLSLTKDNKLKIKFVQGKYNMGGTGVIPNCGKNKYQLIVSRRYASLLNGKEDVYGFTLTRLHKITSTGEYKNSWYEYCVNVEGNIFSFKKENLDVGLVDRKFEYGTFIKLFDYDLPHPSDITLDLWRDLNRYLYSPALPIILFEKRAFRGKSPAKIMYGNRLRILKDDRELVQKIFPLTVETEDVKFPGEITVFKDGVDKGEFVDKMAVVFTINGQVHDYMGNSFITHAVKLPYLAGSLLASFDCSAIPTFIREEVFMPSRDRMRDNALTRSLKDNISKELRDNSFLRELNEARRDQKIFQNPKDDDFMKRLMGKLLSKNDEIARILGIKGDIKNKIDKIMKKETEGRGSSFKGKRFPSYVRLKNMSEGNIKMMPQNGECKVQMETDVEDEYLLRLHDPGELKIKFLTPAIRTGPGPVKPGVPDEEIFNANLVGPNQGEIMARIRSKKELPVGAEVPLDITLTSPSGDIIVHAMIKITNPIQEAKEREVKNKDAYSLPRLIEVYREKKGDLPTPVWTDTDYNWTGTNICKIFPSGEKDHLVDAVAINMDADVIHDYMRQKKLTDKNVEHLKRLFKVAVYLISLMLYFQLADQESIEDKEEMAATLMQGVGKIVIPIVINDEIMKEIEKDD